MLGMVLALAIILWLVYLQLKAYSGKPSATKNNPALKDTGFENAGYSGIVNKAKNVADQVSEKARQDDQMLDNQ